MASPEAIAGNRLESVRAVIDARGLMAAALSARSSIHIVTSPLAIKPAARSTAAQSACASLSGNISSGASGSAPSCYGVSAYGAKQQADA